MRSNSSGKWPAHPTVGQQMSGRFVSASCAIEIDDGVVAENAQGSHIARGKVNSSMRGCGGVEEDMLLLDELAMILLDALELFAHTGYCSQRRCLGWGALHPRSVWPLPVVAGWLRVSR